MKMKFLAGLACGVMMLGLSGMANATLLSVDNGSFEEDGLDGWSSTVYTGGSVLAVTEAAGYVATDGSYFADLTASSSISQIMTWESGDSLSFDWNFNPNGETIYNDYSIFTITGETNFSLRLADIFTGDDQPTGWSTYVYTFENDGEGIVTFGIFNLGANSSRAHLYVDNVKPVPEPATMLLLGTGLAGLIGASRRRKSAQKG